jgi:hypothetical protein
MSPHIITCLVTDLCNYVKYIADHIYQKKQVKQMFLSTKFANKKNLTTLRVIQFYFVGHVPMADQTTAQQDENSQQTGFTMPDL